MTPAERRRGGVPRAPHPGAGRAGQPPARLRAGRGRPAGGVRAGAGALAGRRDAGVAGGVAVHGGPQPGDRPAPPPAVLGPESLEAVARRAPRRPTVDPEPDRLAEVGDERLSLLFTCCHPALAPEARVALTLQAVGGLTGAEIARAFLVPDATMSQRLVRAKRKIRDAAHLVRAARRRRAARPARRGAGGHLPDLQRGLRRHRRRGPGALRSCAPRRCGSASCSPALMPDQPEVLGLVALMLFHDSRRHSPDRRARRADPARPIRTARGGIAREIDEGVRVLNRGAAPAAPGSLPDRGRDRRAARRGAQRAGDRLAADRRALRAAAAPAAVPGGGTQPRGGGRGDRPAGGRAGAGRRDRGPRALPPAARRRGPTSCGGSGALTRRARSTRRALELTRNPAEQEFLRQRLDEM